VIVLNLICNAGHTFEGWFASSEAFDTQVAGGRVNCPHCNASEVTRLPSGAHIRKPLAAVATGNGSEPESQTVAKLIEQLRRLGETSEDVGTGFPDEARKIHYNEVAPRNIRGQASLSETRELLEEGIPVLPILPKKPTH
jgi:hypothetical protein